MPKERNKQPRTGPGTKASADDPGVSAPYEPFPLASGQVTLHQHLVVLEVADASDLTALLVNPGLAALVAARISETAAVVLPDKASRLVLALRKAGTAATVIGDFDG